MTEIHPAGHGLLQAANAFLLLSYLCYDVLFLRITLAFAGLFFVLWAALILDIALDTVIWNTVFMIINTVYAFQIAYARRPISFDHNEHELLYDAMFSKVGVSRLDFKQLLGQALIRRLKKGTVYIAAGNEAANLSVMLTGVLAVMSAPTDGSAAKELAYIKRHEFVESPQWAARNLFKGLNDQATQLDQIIVSTEEAEATGALLQTSDSPNSGSQSESKGDEEATPAAAVEDQSAQDQAMRDSQVFKVSVVAKTNIVFLQWPAERLAIYVEDHPSLAAPLNSLVGADVAVKLFRESETKATAEAELQSGITAVGTTLDDPEHQSLVHQLRQDVGANESLLKYFLDPRTQIERGHADVLLRLGRWRYIRRQGTVLIREGEPVTGLAVVLEGQLAAYKGEGDSQRKLHTVDPMQLAGSVEFLHSDVEHLSSETLIATEVPVKYFSWDADDLRVAVQTRPTLRAALATLVAVDVTAKFRALETAFGSS